MMGTQCDTCRKFASSTPAGWFILARFEAPSPFSGISALIGSSAAPSAPDGPVTLCSPKCLAEYAYVLAVTGSGGAP